MIKHVKRLPKSYVIEIEDMFDQKTIVDGLRLNFTTYAAAKSYSEFYSDMYGMQYKFRVVGRNKVPGQLLTVAKKTSHDEK